MDLRSCCGLGGHSSFNTIHLGGRHQSYNSSTTSSTSSSIVPSGRSRKTVKWRGIWTMLVKEKRGNVDRLKVPSYDSYTYSQNFDQGVPWDEPENVSRSFSVRFADPALSSRVYGKTMSPIIELG